MKSKKVLSSLGLIVAIISGIILGRLLEDLTSIEAQGPTVVQVPVQNVPIDFDWKTYVQNYEDLKREGIDTEEKAKQHWLEFGKSEGRDYHMIGQAKLPEPVAEVDKTFDVTPVVTPHAIPRVSFDSPLFDPASLRERYNKILKRAGIDTKEEAMEFSLAFWEKRRKDYFS